MGFPMSKNRFFAHTLDCQISLVDRGTMYCSYSVDREFNSNDLKKAKVSWISWNSKWRNSLYMTSAASFLMDGSFLEFFSSGESHVGTITISSIATYVNIFLTYYLNLIRKLLLAWKLLQFSNRCGKFWQHSTISDRFTKNKRFEIKLQIRSLSIKKSTLTQLSRLITYLKL